MIRRSLNERFPDKVLEEIKYTTIRDKAWPMGRPIMLFRWSGKPYRSKQIDVAPIIVTESATIRITRNGENMTYYTCPLFVAVLWRSEGFSSQADMDAWFRPLLKDGETQRKYIMRFRLLERSEA